MANDRMEFKVNIIKEGNRWISFIDEIDARNPCKATISTRLLSKDDLDKLLSMLRIHQQMADIQEQLRDGK